MCISHFEPSSVYLRITEYSKLLRCDAYIIPKQEEAKSGIVINAQNYNFDFKRGIFG